MHLGSMKPLLFLKIQDFSSNIDKIARYKTFKLFTFKVKVTRFYYLFKF